MIGPSGFWTMALLCYAAKLIPSFPWIVPGWRAWGRNPRKGRDQVLPSGNHVREQLMAKRERDVV